MPTPLPASNGASPLTRFLLGCGIVAGPLYLVVGFAQAALRDGFDVRYHALSLLSNGPLGWVQVANFLVAGVLVLAGAVGVRRLLRGSRGGTWGPLLLLLYGVGLLGAGLFVADPGRGFPPGTPVEPSGLSRAGLLHFVFGAIGFYALIAACFVFARRFAGLGRPGWAAYSALTGVGFLVAFLAIASGEPSAAVMLAFYLAVTWIWVWHSALLLELRRGPATATLGAGTRSAVVPADAGRQGRHAGARLDPGSRRSPG